MPDLAIICSSIITAIVTIISIRALWRGSIDFMPSLGWCALMAIPFIIDFPLFSPATRMLHGGVVAVFLALIFTTDWYANKKNAALPTPDFSFKAVHLAYAMAITYVALTLLHFATADSIPFLDTLKLNKPGYNIDEARASFSRSYDFIPGMKYVFSFATVLLGMPAVLLLYINRKFFPALALFLWVIFYCVASTAKGPMILTLLIICIGLIHLARSKQRIRFARIFIGLSAAALIAMAAVTLSPASRGTPYTVFSHLETKYNHPQMLREDRPMLLGDYVRPHRGLPIESCTGFICRNVDYLEYRVFITPIEVSARWYEYFNIYPVTDIKLSRMIHDSRTDKLVHPAQAVGIWAFAEPFPKIYNDLVYAYPSMDADAYGRYGWKGLIVIALIYIALRLGTVYFNDNGTMTRGSFYAVAVALLAFLPANAGMQAMIVAQGVGAVMAAMMALWFMARQGAINKTPKA